MNESTRPTTFRPKLNLKIPRSIRLDILEAATGIPGKALHLLIGIWLLVTIRNAPTVPLSRRTMQRVSVSRFAATDALRRLENAGILKVQRNPGRSSSVTLLEPGTANPLNLS